MTREETKVIVDEIWKNLAIARKNLMETRLILASIPKRKAAP